MPYKTDKMKLGNPSIDRRVKMLPHHKEEAKILYKDGMSINGISKHFRVNKRLIQFILFPERQKKNIQDRKLRGGSTIYYKKEYHTKAVREHRQYKYATLTGRKNKMFLKTNLDKIAEYRIRSCKRKKSDDKRKQISRNELKEWYVVSNLKSATGLSSEDIKQYPQLIEAMRKHIIFRRAIKEKLKTITK